MDSIANPELLTPNILFQSPVHVQSKNDSSISNEETVNISVCSEFTTYHIPATIVDSRHKPGIALDTAHAPVVFTVGNEGHLFCIQRMNPESWKATDITPGGSSTTVVTFDVYQHSTGKVAVAVATTDGGSSTAPTIYFAKPFVLENYFDPTKISFSRISNKPATPFVSMTIAASDPDLETPCFIIVGTKATASERAIDYTVSTDPSASTVWEAVSLPENATEVLKVLPITLMAPFNGCIASFYKQNRSDPTPPDVADAISCLTLDDDVGLNVFVDLEELKGGRDMATTVTQKGLSDIFVAGVHGVGYFASKNRYHDSPVILLPSVSFQQIVASENKRKISVFAVSTDGDLHYIEGTRNTATSTPKFYVPEHPIKNYVGGLSTQYNAGVNACEAMYIDTTNHLKHLWRDSISQTWSEQTIHVQDLKTSISYPAFISKIHIQGSKGTAIGSGYDIGLSATELVYATINDAACRLDKDPTKFSLDADGTIHIVIQAGPQLGAPTITAVLHSEKDPDYGFRVEPRQRMLRNWGNFHSGSELKNAKSTDGKPIFPNSEIHDDSFDAAAALLQEAPSMVSCVDNNVTTLMGTHSTAAFSGSETTPPPHVFAVQRMHPTRHVVSATRDWIDWAEDALDAVGDFLESVWNGVADIAKFAFKIADGVVNFFAEIAGKALRWVLDTVGTVIRCVCTFLKDVLGIDLTRFLALFGFLFDYPNILKTQQVIVKTVKDGCSLLQGAVEDNTIWMKTYIQQLRPLIGQFISDERVPQTEGLIGKAKSALEDSFLGKLLKSVLNNPIINTIMRYASMWMLQTISLLEEEISFPGINDLEKLLEEKFTTLLETFLKDSETGLVDLIRDIFNGFAKVASGTRNIGDMFSVVFSDLFWSIFDTAQDVALALIDMLSDVIGGIVKVITSPIKFPRISAFWEAFTETPFSIVDIGSMILARVLYLVTMMWQEKLPFEVMEPWDTLLPPRGSIHFPNINTGYTNIDVHQKAEAVDKESESVNILPYMTANLGICLISSFASLSNSGLELSIFSPKATVEGYEMDAIGEATVDPPELKAKKSALPSIQRLQLSLSGIQLVARIASLVNELITPGALVNVTPRVVILPVTKLLAIAMVGIGFGVRIFNLKSNTSYQWAPYLEPVGNIIGTLPEAIWSFVDSEETTTDDLVLLTMSLNTVAAGCDIITTVLSQKGQDIYKWIPFGISAVLIVGQAGTTIAYYVDYKAEHPN